LIHGKNNFAERSKISLDTDLKVILSERQNNFVEIKIMSSAAKNFDTLATSFYIIILMVQQNYFLIYIQLKF